MTRLQYFYIIIGVCLAGHGFAATPDSTRVERASWWHRLADAGRQNPAFMADAFRYSRSELSLHADYKHQNQPLVLQEGKGHFLPQAAVSTYLKISGRSAVWGEASYMNGQQNDQLWNSTADYALLAPYVLADSVGGNVRRERYILTGGYGTHIKKWMVGGELRLRAEQAYRTVDPRMRGVITDLTLKMGTAYNTQNYRWGMAVWANIYKQANDVDIYNELGGAAEYVMLGLGNYNRRFSGSNTDIYVKGGATGTLLSLHPLQGSGFFADLLLSSLRHQRISDSHNYLPLTMLYTTRASITAGWKHDACRRYALYATLSTQRKHGDEYIAGDAVGGIYPTLAQLTMYKHHHTEAYLTALYGGSRPSVWNVKAVIGFQDDNERYVYPERKQTVKHLFGSLQGQSFFAPTERLTVEGHLKAAYYASLQSAILMPYAEMKPSIISLVDHNYAQLRASYTWIETHWRADCQPLRSRYALFMALGVAAAFNNVANNHLHLQLTAGVTF